MLSHPGIKAFFEKIVTHAACVAIGVFVTGATYLPGLQRDVAALQASSETTRKKTDRIYESVANLTAELARTNGVLDSIAPTPPRQRLLTPAVRDLDVHE